MFFQYHQTVFWARRRGNKPYKLRENIQDFDLKGDTLCFHVQSHEIGDVLIYTVDSDGQIKEEKRAYLPKAAPDYDAQTLISPGNGRLHIYLPDKAELISSRQAYYRFVDTVSFDSTRSIRPQGYTDQNWYHFHVDERDVWYLLGSPYPRYITRNPSPGEDKPRMLAMSHDRGRSWQVDTLDLAWPLKFERSPQLSVEYAGGERIIQLSSAYKKGEAPWKIPGNQYREAGLMPYDGANLIDPLRPGIAYHATNKGMAVSYHYGDSLFLENSGTRSPLIRDLSLDKKTREGYTAGITGLHQVSEYGEPWEFWEGPHVIRPFDFISAVDFSRQDPERVYAGWKRLYRSKAGGKEGSWEKVLDPLRIDSNRYRRLRSLEKIYVSPVDEQLILAHFRAAHEFIMISYDGGSTWAEVFYDSGFLGIDAWTVTYQDGVYKLVTVKNGTAPKVRTQPVAPFERLAPATEEIVQMNWPLGIAPYFQQMKTAENGASLFMVGHASSADVSVPVVFKKEPNQDWEMMEGPPQPNCYGCYTAGEAIAITKDAVFAGVGHKIFKASREFKDSLRPVYQYPAFTRITGLAPLEGLLMVATEAGVFEHRLSNFRSRRDEGNALRVFPNPTRGELHYYPPARVQLFDGSGQQVYKSATSETHLQLNSLSEGLYHLIHPLGTKKIIKR